MKVIFFLLVLCQNAGAAIDVVAESLKQVTKNVDPCTDFFRHACPEGAKHPINDMVAPELSARYSTIFYKKENQFEIVNDFTSTLSSFIPDDWRFSQFSQLFLEKCKSGQNTLPLLERLEQLFSFSPKTMKMEPFCTGGSYCATQLKGEKNCERGTQQLKDTFDKYWPESFIEKVGELVEKINDHRTTMIANQLALQPDMRNGFSIIQTWLKKMKVIMLNWIPKTRWVQETNSTSYIMNMVEKMSLRSGFQDYMIKSRRALKTANKKYVECMRSNKYTKETLGSVLCLVHSSIEMEKVADKNPAMLKHNAYNRHPQIKFGVTFVYAVSHIKEMAAKLGFLAKILGHEIGHSIIEDFNSYFVEIPDFPRNVTDCFQNMFAKTCEKFKEISCDVDDRQIDENGSDIVGFDLAYKLLEDYYGKRIDDIYAPYQMTYKQLFYYGTVYDQCYSEPVSYNTDAFGNPTGEHSVFNIRVNLVGHFPAFKSAFNCSDSSKMIANSVEKCVVYGQ